jgi:hypothetical protein
MLLPEKVAALGSTLLHFQDTRGDIYLVTNVLDEQQLTDAQASEIYRRRWGIEVQFRSFKQTFQRSKLRCRTPDCVEIELHWSLVGLWIIQLLALKERTTLGEPDEQTSVAAAIRVIRNFMNNHSVVRPAANRWASDSRQRRLTATSGRARRRAATILVAKKNHPPDNQRFKPHPRHTNANSVKFHR